MKASCDSKQKEHIGLEADFSSLPDSMWLNRPLGAWADELIRWCGGRCTLNLVAHITTKDEHNIDVNLFRQAVFALMYNEPHLRTDADLRTTPAHWVPATDFSEAFYFEDLRDQGFKSVADVWHLVEKETNHSWKIGTGKPLYKCSLSRIIGGYVVMNIYHHSAADGTSGLLMMGEIMRQYKLLEEGKDVVRKPHKPRGPMEELVRCELERGECNAGVVKELIKQKVKWATEWKPMLPFDMNEHEENKNGAFINKLLFRDGTKENYLAIRKRCKKEGVSVGSIAAAASYMAMAEMHAKSTCGVKLADYKGMKDQYMDIPVNIRHRIEGIDGYEYAAFYVTKVTLKCDVMLDTELWDLARNIQQQMETILAQKQHLHFAQAREEWETGEGTKDLAMNSFKEGKKCDAKVSNLMFYNYPTDFGWGEISSLYCGCSVLVPHVSNMFLLFQACSSKFTYTLVYCPGENNKNIATEYIDMFVKYLENSHLSVMQNIASI